MITEDYVNFETAKLLKDKGFDENCSRSYVKDKLAVSQGFNNSYYTTMYSDGTYRPISAPTLQMAMKWLRKNFNLNPVPYALSLGWAFDVFDLSDRDITGCKKLYSMDFPTKNACYETYEEACEAAIKYCLENLI